MEEIDVLKINGDDDDDDVIITYMAEIINYIIIMTGMLGTKRPVLCIKLVQTILTYLSL